MRIVALALLGASLGAAAPALAGGTVAHEIRYPTRFEPRAGPYGVVMVPTDFATRETGTVMEAVVAGVAMAVQANGRPAVRLQLEDGRSLLTRPGMWIKMDGIVYRTIGWKDDGFHLVSRNGDRRLRFVVR
jgi:hypothetical protein